MASETPNGTYETLYNYKQKIAKDAGIPDGTWVVIKDDKVIRRGSSKWEVMKTDPGNDVWLIQVGVPPPIIHIMSLQYPDKITETIKTKYDIIA